MKSIECYAVEFDIFLDKERQPLKDFKVSYDLIF